MRTDHVCSCLVTSAAREWIDQSCDDRYPVYRFAAYQRDTGLSYHRLPSVTGIRFTRSVGDRSSSTLPHAKQHLFKPFCGARKHQSGVHILDGVRIMPSLPSFSSILPIYCKTSCPKHDVKLHNYALTITTTTRGTCLWSRYPVLVIIRELEDSTSRPSVAS